MPDIIFPPRFTVVSADLSFRRPGFARFECEKTDHGLELHDITTGFVDNKLSKKKTTGEILNEITHFMVKFFPADREDVPSFFVRERALDKYASSGRQAVTLEQIFKVVGLTDAFLWRIYKREFMEIHPKTVKKIITGNGLADKEEVAVALEKYVGPREYKVDDESDALAIGLAFLIMNGALEAHEESQEMDRKVV